MPVVCFSIEVIAYLNDNIRFWERFTFTIIFNQLPDSRYSVVNSFSTLEIDNELYAFIYLKFRK